MKAKWILTAFVLVFSARYARAQAPPTGIHLFGSNESFPLVPPRAVEPGAVYQVKLRIRWEKVEQYLADYAKWFLPVDQMPDSGRKLLSVLTREHGDQYNIVFLWRYDDAWKQDYYCKYSKAFFKYHAATLKARGSYYQILAAERGWTETVDDILRTFEAPCSSSSTSTLQPALEIARATFHKLDLTEFAPKIESDEGSWYFDVNLCKAEKLNMNQKLTDEALENPLKPQQSLCPWSRQSLLERAVRELSWEPH